MAGLGFAEAWDMAPGGRVVYGGVVRTVTAVERKGKDAPYYRFADHEGSALGNWYSWQLCGQAPAPEEPPTWQPALFPGIYPTSILGQSDLFPGQGKARKRELPGQRDMFTRPDEGFTLPD